MLEGSKYGKVDWPEWGGYLEWDRGSYYKEMKSSRTKEIMVSEESGVWRPWSGDCRNVGREKEKLFAIRLSTLSFGEQPLQGVQEGHTNHTTVTKIQQTNDRKAIQQKRVSAVSYSVVNMDFMEY